jgi:hypothetical protein
VIVEVEVDLDEFVVDLVQFVLVAEEYDVQAEVIDVPEEVMVARIVTPERYAVGLVDLAVESDDPLVADFEDLEEVVPGDREVARDDPEEVVMAARVPDVLEAGLENLGVVDYLGKEVVVG